MSVATTKLTYEDYLTFPEDGRRHELIDGEHYVTPSPNLKHQIVSKNLVVAIELHLRKTRAGTMLHAPFDVILTDIDVVQPDILVVLSGRRSILASRGATAAPDLVVEILSESNRRHDEVRKRKLYEREGVKEYWIVDPELELVKILRRDTGAFERVAEVSVETGGTLTTPLLPGFELPIAEVFAEQ